MGLHRAHGDAEPRGDGRVGQTAADEFEDLRLARAEYPGRATHRPPDTCLAERTLDHRRHRHHAVPLREIPCRAQCLDGAFAFTGSQQTHARQPPAANFALPMVRSPQFRGRGVVGGRPAGIAVFRPDGGQLARNRAQ